jgi:hypothetical protein
MTVTIAKPSPTTKLMVSFYCSFEGLAGTPLAPQVAEGDFQITMSAGGGPFTPQPTPQPAFAGAFTGTFLTGGSASILVALVTTASIEFEVPPGLVGPVVVQAQWKSRLTLPPGSSPITINCDPTLLTNNMGSNLTVSDVSV